MATTTSTKRPSTDTGGPPAKRPNLAMSPLDIGPAAGEEDLDMKVLQVIAMKAVVTMDSTHKSVHCGVFVGTEPETE